VQTAVETAYTLMKDNIAGGNMDRKTATKWFAFIGTLFLFIWFSNIIGYLPLPTNTEHKIDIFGIAFPTFALYAATANISVTLALTLVVWISYHIEGIRAKGLVGYLKGWVPEGITGVTAIPIFGIEVISHFVRIISLSVRLFANLLAGHLLILFMGGGLVVLLGIAALGVLTIPAAFAFFVFEVLLIATLQAFIFSTLTAIYLGESVAEHH
jgi:F-type H+-transporting ATPase subunit a